MGISPSASFAAVTRTGGLAVVEIVEMTLSHLFVRSVQVVRGTRETPARLIGVGSMLCVLEQVARSARGGHAHQGMSRENPNAR